MIFCRDFLKEHKQNKGIWIIKNNCYSYGDIYVKSKDNGEWWLPLSVCNVILLDPMINEILPEELFKI